MIGNTFGIAKSTTSIVIWEICGILTEKIAPEFIKVPTAKADVGKSSCRLLEWFGFLQVIGCVDGTHIPIGQPSENSQDNFSYIKCAAQSTAKLYVMLMEILLMQKLSGQVACTMILCLQIVQFRKAILPENANFFTSVIRWTRICTTANFGISCLPTFTLCTATQTSR